MYNKEKKYKKPDLEIVNQQHRPQEVPDTGLLCDLLWSDPDNEI